MKKANSVTPEIHILDPARARPAFTTDELRILVEEHRRAPLSNEELATLRKIKALFNAAITGRLTKKERLV